MGDMSYSVRGNELHAGEEGIRSFYAHTMLSSRKEKTFFYFLLFGPCEGRVFMTFILGAALPVLS